MKNHCVKQESLSDLKTDHPAPKLHLVKGGSQPDDIFEQVGLSHPNEIIPTSSETNNTEKSPEHLQALADVELFRAKKINATELRKRYPETYINWSGMKTRCRADPQTGMPPIDLHPCFVKFPDFLEFMGPRPEPTWSVDRKDPTGPYSPDNVRWASKTTQARNRTNTVTLTYLGITLPLVEWAEKNGVNADTYRGRKNAGWSDEEIITGESRRAYPTGNTVHSHNSRNPFEHTPWPTNAREEFEHYYQLYGHHGEHRLGFIKRYSIKRMNAITERADEVSWPEDYTPTPDEILEAMELDRRYKRWQAVLGDATKKMSPDHPARLYTKLHLPAWVESSLAKFATGH